MRTVALIPTYNRPFELRNSWDRIRPLLGAELELIVVDDASTDHRQLALLDEIERGPERVTVVRLRENNGCTRARKAVLDTLDAEYVIILDDDSYFSSPHADLVPTIISRFEEDDRLGVQAFPCVVPSLSDRERARGRAFSERRIAGRFVNCGCAFRVRAYKDVGGYRSEFENPYGEERDLAIRMMARGWIVRQYREPLVIHEQSPTARNAFANERGNAHNYLRFVWWYHPTWLALPYSVSIIAKLIGHALHPGRSLKGTLAGIRDFARELRSGLRRTPLERDMLKIYHSVQHRTVVDPAELRSVKRESIVRVFLSTLWSTEGADPAPGMGQEMYREPLGRT